MSRTRQKNEPHARSISWTWSADFVWPSRRNDWGAAAPACRRCENIGGKLPSFGAWRQRARLLRALELLAEGTTVTRTAIAVGYDSTSAFVAAFRRALGKTPGRYFRGDGR